MFSPGSSINHSPKENAKFSYQINLNLDLDPPLAPEPSYTKMDPTMNTWSQENLLYIILCKHLKQLLHQTESWKHN